MSAASSKSYAMLRPDAPVIVGGDSDHFLAAEQFRTLAVQLQQAMRPQDDGGYVLGITSPEPNVGKTMVALNLVLTLAPPGTTKRILLVESDLWHPTLGTYLDVEPGQPGLYDLLLGKCSFDQAKVPVWASMVDLVFAGRSGEVGNLMTDRRMEQILEDARRTYELVILDSPPFFLSSGRSLSGLSDGILVLARAGQTKKNALEQLLGSLAQEKVLGMSLTCVPEKLLAAETASAYSYYAYRRRDEKGRQPLRRPLNLKDRLARREQE